MHAWVCMYMHMISRHKLCRDSAFVSYIRLSRGSQRPETNLKVLQLHIFGFETCINWAFADRSDRKAWNSYWHCFVSRIAATGNKWKIDV